ncbi:MAG: CPBP family intramembrane metalloprotease [Methanomassiliicoccales archaeon]|nr:MAG: CPBP family intramembrane metalloprotease [Methanomassiliicoccales archaeon]
MNDDEKSESIVTENELQEDNKWYGVPPKGEKPLPEKQKYVLWILGIIVLEICIWAVYRNLSAPYISPFGSVKFYIAHIIFAPTIHLIPILIFWRYIRKERGFPFVFTKKLLMSAIIVGFVGAIIWRLLEEFSYDAMAGAAGGTVPGTMTFFNLLDPPLLFSIMTFVQFFIVGPVEELEFRSFAQDQSSRVLPNWQALVFSSVLFGCSHIPIALFVYQLPPHIFVAALWSWISAGFVFGVLYIYSRNIFACIIMHGMGNWQLSVFYFQSAETTMDPTSYALVNIATSLIADVIMILIFFFIHKYYWQPHRRGEPAFKGKLIELQNFIRNHDFGKEPIKKTAAFLVAFCVVICGIIMGTTYALGETDLSKMSSLSEEEGAKDISHLESLSETTEHDSGSQTLNEGESETITLVSESDKYLKEVSVTVIWTDEEDMSYILRTYENQPDTFSVTINGPNATEKESGENPRNGEGSITATLSFSIEEISDIISTDVDEYEVIIEITMEDAGDYESFGLIGFVDDGNQYDYEIESVWLVPEE